MSERYTIMVRAQLEKVDLARQVKELEKEISTRVVESGTRQTERATTASKAMENQVTRWNNTLREMESRDPKIFDVESVKNARKEFVDLIDAFQLGKVSADDVNTSLDTLKANISVSSDQFRVGTEQAMGFSDALVNAAKKVLLWAGATQIIYGSLHAIKGGIEYLRELNKEMTVIRFVTGLSAEEVRKLSVEYSNLAQVLGVTTQEVAQGAAEWFRAGYSADEAIKLKEASIRMGTLADIEAAQATNLLLSMINGFKLEVDEVLPAIDKLVQLDNELATSVEEIAVAMQYSANSAQLAGVTYDELASYIATVSSVTRQSAQRIGNAFKSIFTRMQRVKAGFEFDDEGESINEVEQVLNRLNVTTRDAVDQFRPMGEVMDDIAEKWDTLSNAQQQQIAGAIAGYYQTENFITLMENYDDVIAAQASQMTALGTTMERYEIYLEGIEAAQKRSEAAWQRVWAATINEDVILFFTNLSGSIGSVIADVGGLGRVIGLLGGLFVAINFDKISGGLVLLGANIKSTIAGFKAATTAATVFHSALGVIGMIFIAVNAILMLKNAFFDLEKKIQDANEKMAETMQEVAKISQTTTALPQLWKEMEELANKTERSAEETEKLYEIYSRINSLVPGVAGYYNDLGQFIVDLNVPMEHYVKLLERELQAKRDLMALDAATQMDNYLDAYQNAIKEHEKDLRLMEGMQQKFDLKKQWDDGLISQEAYVEGVHEIADSMNFGLDFIRSQAFWHDTLIEGQRRLALSARDVATAVTDYTTNFIVLDPVLQNANLNVLRLTDGVEELYVDLLKLSGLASDDSFGDLLEFLKTGEGPQQPLSGMAEGANVATDAIISLNSELKGILSSFHDMGSLSPQDVMKLQEMFPEDYLDLLEWTGTQMKLNEEALKALALARIQDAIAANEHALALDATDEAARRNLDVLRALYAEFQSGAGSYESLTSAIINQTNELYSLSESAAKTIYDFEQLGHMTPQMVSAFQKQYPLEFAQALEVVDGQVILNVHRLRELVLAQAEAALKATEHALSLDKMNVSLQIAAASQKNFIAALRSGEYWKEQEYNISLSVSGAGQSGPSPAQLALEGEIKAREESIKAIEREIKALEDRKKALKSQLDQFKKYIQAQKDSLRVAREEEEFRKNIAKKEKDLAKIKTQIDILSLDDSEWAQKRRLELEEEAANLEEEITEDKEDRKYKLQIEALDRVLQAFQDGIDAQIAAIDKLIEAHRNDISVQRDIIAAIREQISELSKAQNAVQQLSQATKDYGIDTAWTIDGIIDKLREEKGELGELEGRMRYQIGLWKQLGLSHIEAMARAAAYFAYIQMNIALLQHLNSLSYPGVRGRGGEDREYHSGGVVEEHHDGNSFAGQLNSNEVFAKLLKGEYVATQGQMDNFINNVLPKMVGYPKQNASQAGDMIFETTIHVEGNVDKEVIPDLKNIISSTVLELMEKKGVRRNVSSFSL